MAALGTKIWEAEVTLSDSAQKYHTERSLIDVYDGCPIDLSIFISCYNEQDYIADTLETIRGVLLELPHLSYEILVIDDVSKDGSVAIVEDYIRQHPEMNIILRKNKHNRGLAQNYFDSAFLARGKYYRLICGDNAEPASSIKTVFEQIGSADILVPYYTSSEGKNWRRMLISKTFTTIINTVTGYKFHYYNGLAVHLRYNVMRWHPNTHGFGFQADLLCMLLDLGFTYKEVPIITIEKREGKSNAITFKNLLSVTHTIIDIIIRRISNRVYKK